MDFKKCIAEILKTNDLNVFIQPNEDQAFMCYLDEQLKPYLDSDAINATVTLHNKLEENAGQGNSASIDIKTEYGSGMMSVTSEYTKIVITLIDCKPFVVTAPTFDLEELNPLLQYFSLFIKTQNFLNRENFAEFVNNSILLEPIF